jgi:plasmid stability protein
MATTIEIHNIPDALHLRLQERAEQAGLSLSDYLLREIMDLAEKPMPEKRPSLDEVLARIERWPGVETSESAADIIRELRGPLP